MHQPRRRPARRRNRPDGQRLDGGRRLPGASRADRARRLARGAVATSTTLRRRWHVGGEIRHHLIDPATGRPSDSNLTFVTVVAGHAWTAEVLAKAVLLHGTPLPFDLVAAQGAAALTVDRDGRVEASPGIGDLSRRARFPTSCVTDDFERSADAS